MDVRGAKPQDSCIEVMEPLKPSVIACRIFAVPIPDGGVVGGGGGWGEGEGVVGEGVYRIGDAGLVWGLKFKVHAPLGEKESTCDDDAIMSMYPPPHMTHMSMYPPPHMTHMSMYPPPQMMMLLSCPLSRRHVSFSPPVTVVLRQRILLPI